MLGGRAVEILIGKHGAPSTIGEVGNSHKTYRYIREGCTFIFTVHANGLVVDGKSVGHNCKKGYPTFESMQIPSIPGWLRYDGPNGMSMIAVRAASRLLVEDYDGVDRLFVELSNPKLRLNDGGRMVTGLSDIVREARSMMTNDMIRERLAAWHIRDPHSPAAPMIELMLWRKLAWEARGGGFAASVAKEGWELFFERMARAEKALIRVPDAPNHPVWYSEYLEIARDTGWPKERLLELFKQAKRAHPGY
ncbi:MAG: hypothetical protein OEZ08_07395 [Betaproteobacteria bacterium]|nr:hypothetical protein [Betaproteobacteria bacterium]